MLDAPRRSYSLIILSGVLLAACTSPSLDLDHLPFRLEEVRELGQRELGQHVQVVDLDGDGRDEIINRLFGTWPEADNAVVLKNSEGRYIAQANYQGLVNNPVHTLDYDGDGIDEILIPYIRRDSLFVSLIRRDGTKLFHFFLTDGKPRQEPDGVLPWDVVVRKFYLEDVNQDARKELVTVVSTGYSRLPRGVLVHTLPEGRLLGKSIIGALPENSFTGDFDGDGIRELVLGTFAADNGAVAGGLDDRHAYLIVFELGATPEISWMREVGGLGSRTHLTLAEFAGDGHPLLLACVISRYEQTVEVRLEMIAPGNWQTIRRITLSEPLSFPLVLDLDRDTVPEILLPRLPDEIWILNDRFEVTHRRDIGTSLEWLQTVPDMDGDGVEELAGVTSNNRIILLGTDFSIKASFPTTNTDMNPQDVIRGSMRRGISSAPYLLARRGNQTIALHLVENRFYYIYRYGPQALWLLGLVSILLLSTGTLVLRRRNRALQALQSLVMETSGRGLLVVDGHGRIVVINNLLREWLHLNADSPLEGRPYREVIGATSRLGPFLQAVLAADVPHHHEEKLSLALNGREQAILASAEPVQRERRLFWLVSLHLPNGREPSAEAKTWFFMARKVTHDIKNPLNGILLTAQRLQTEYGRYAPEAAPALDPLTERILEQVERLRRMTKQYLKILDVERLDLLKTDLSQFVCEAESILEGMLPPDTRLTLQLEPDLPPVLADREQMRMLLENLTANGARALPEGGTISVNTYLVSNLRVPHSAYEPRDYVILEVQDNGAGIPEADRGRLFEPGFTTSPGGSGLGLALVKMVVERHDGFVEVESEPGVGTTFSIHLPTAEP